MNRFPLGYQGWLTQTDPEKAESHLPKGPLEGEPFPEYRMALIRHEKEIAYLGLPTGSQLFSLRDIRTEYLLLILMNEMCALCMAELPQIDRVARLALEDEKLRSRLRILGLAAGSTKRATARMRNERRLEFVLLADEKWRLFEKLGRPELPIFYLLKKDPAAGLIAIWRHVGGIGNPHDFLERLRNLAEPRR